jgi:hypothetical protein
MIESLKLSTQLRVSFLKVPLKIGYKCRGNKTFTTGLFLSPVMMWHTHIWGRPPPLHAMPWVGRVWASNRVKSVSFYLGRKHIVCMLHVLAYSSNKRPWIIWVVLLYFSWELNKDYTVTEDPSRYLGIGPSTIQPQHKYSKYRSYDLTY